MQKADPRLCATVFSTIFQSRLFLLDPGVALLQQRFGRGKMVGRHGAAPCSAV